MTTRVSMSLRRERNSSMFPVFYVLASMLTGFYSKSKDYISDSDEEMT